MKCGRKVEDRNKVYKRIILIGLLLVVAIVVFKNNFMSKNINTLTSDKLPVVEETTESAKKRILGNWAGNTEDGSFAYLKFEENKFEMFYPEFQKGMDGVYSITDAETLSIYPSVIDGQKVESQTELKHSFTFQDDNTLEIDLNGAKAVLTKSNYNMEAIKQQSNSNQELIVDENELGNKPANISHGGLAAIKDEYIYYSNWSDNGIIYKMTSISADTEKIGTENDCNYINIIGDWVFFTKEKDHEYKIYKMKLDGSDLSSYDVIADYQEYDRSSITHLSIKGNWMYYATSYGIYKINIDGSQNTKIVELENNDEGYSTRIRYINIIDDTLYYVDVAEKNIIYAADVNTNEKKVVLDSINKEIMYIDISDQWIYYSNSYEIDGAMNYDLTKFNSATQEEIILIKGDRTVQLAAVEVSVHNDWLYYTDFNRNLKRMRTDGTEDTQLNYQDTNGLNLVGIWAIYRIAGANNLTLERIPE